MPDLKKQLSKLPDLPGVYWFKDKSGNVLYIGKAISLRKRVRSYFKKSFSEDAVKTQKLVQNIYDIGYKTAATELEALLLEGRLIKLYQPHYNIFWKDDKNFPYIKITVNEPWPKVIIARKILSDGAKYFGPFRAKTAKYLIRLVKKMFALRWCDETPLKMRKQPCLHYHIRRCSGPCLGKTNKNAYRKMVKSVFDFLQGDIAKARKQIENEMNRASDSLNFEAAADLRNRLAEIDRFADEFSMSERGDPKIRMDELAKLRQQLKLSKLPRRIEAFDISNTSGVERVGAMAVFEAGMPKKSDYRRFKIIGESAAHDDTAAIGEIVGRRYSGSLRDKLPLPDLVLVDGGKAQANAAQSALQEIGIDIFIAALAKKEERLFFPGGAQSLKLPDESPALHILQRIRDEAHRFAVSFHRQRRKKRLFA